jgi:hypothetical protein
MRVFEVQRERAVVAGRKTLGVVVVVAVGGLIGGTGKVRWRAQ